MKDKTFIAVNMNDFHANQNGKAETNVQLLFILAKTIEDAQEHLKLFHPGNAWSLIPKTEIDRGIVRESIK